MLPVLHTTLGRRPMLPVQSTAQQTRHWNNVGSMLACRLRRWSNMNPTLVQCLKFAGRLHIQDLLFDIAIWVSVECDYARLNNRECNAVSIRAKPKGSSCSPDKWAVTVFWRGRTMFGPTHQTSNIIQVNDHVMTSGWPHTQIQTSALHCQKAVSAYL